MCYNGAGFFALEHALKGDKTYLGRGNCFFELQSYFVD